MTRSLRILGFESFDEGSHRAVRERLTQHSRHQWTWFTRPGRGWKWRMRAAALEFAAESARIPADVLVVTSLLDAAHLVALRSRLGCSARVPLVLYRHENQAAYPVQDAAPAIARHDMQFAMTDLASIAAADLTIWNSRWNLESFRTGMHRLLRAAPDFDRRAVLDDALSRSIVLPPPVEAPPDDLVRARQHAECAADRAHDATARRDAMHPATQPVRILWPHRWEHDKGPEELLAIMRRDAERLNLRLTVLGATSGGGRTHAGGGAVNDAGADAAAVRTALLREFAHRIDHAGFARSRREYWEHVTRCDWVLSTARHEFFGIAVAEALLAGSLPWLPDRLSYPELVPSDLIGLSPEHPPADPDAARRRIAEHLAHARPEAAVRAIDEAIERVVGDRATRDDGADAGKNAVCTACDDAIRSGDHPDDHARGRSIR